MLTHREKILGRETDPGIDYLKTWAESRIDSCYGPNSPQPLDYHNVEHTFGDVLPAAKKLVANALDSGTIDQTQARQVIAATILHDVVHGLAPGINEDESTKLAAAIMRNCGYFSADDIAVVSTIIPATAAGLDLVEQRIIQPKVYDHLSGLTADADLSILSAPFLRCMEMQKRITREHDPSRTFQANDYADFVRRQWQVTKNHQYHTPEAQELFGPGLERNAELWHILSNQCHPGVLNSVITLQPVEPQIDYRPSLN